jgi:hypothetical protein
LIRVNAKEEKTSRKKCGRRGKPREGGPFTLEEKPWHALESFKAEIGPDSLLAKTMGRFAAETGAARGQLPNSPAWGPARGNAGRSGSPRR